MRRMLRSGVPVKIRAAHDGTGLTRPPSTGRGSTPPRSSWIELSPIKWVAELGLGPLAPAHPELVCRRLLVRSTGARQRCGDTALVSNVPPEVLSVAELEPFLRGPPDDRRLALGSHRGAAAQGQWPNWKRKGTRDPRQLIHQGKRFLEAGVPILMIESRHYRERASVAHGCGGADYRGAWARAGDV
jgi:hypothetical protein